MARPTKRKDELRLKQISVRLTDHEYSIFKAIVAAHGQPDAEVARRLMAMGILLRRDEEKNPFDPIYSAFVGDRPTSAAKGKAG